MNIRKLIKKAFLIAEM